MSSCADELVTPLPGTVHDFRKFLNEECLPKEWKQARVYQYIRRGHERHQATVVTSVPGKVFESIIKNLLEHVEDHNMSKKATWIHELEIFFDYLLETFEEVTSMLDGGDGVDMIYLDYSKQATVGDPESNWTDKKKKKERKKKKEKKRKKKWCAAGLGPWTYTTCHLHQHDQ